jgi:hypothetical protein
VTKKERENISSNSGFQTLSIARDVNQNPRTAQFLDLFNQLVPFSSLHLPHFKFN